MDSIKRSAQAPVSLEKPVGDEEESEFGQFIADERAESPYERAAEILTKEGPSRGPREPLLPGAARPRAPLRTGRRASPHTRRGGADVQRHPRANPPDREPVPPRSFRASPRPRSFARWPEQDPAGAATPSRQRTPLGAPQVVRLVERMNVRESDTRSRRASGRPAAGARPAASGRTGRPPPTRSARADRSVGRSRRRRASAASTPPPGTWPGRRGQRRSWSGRKTRSSRARRRALRHRRREQPLCDGKPEQRCAGAEHRVRRPYKRAGGSAGGTSRRRRSSSARAGTPRPAARR